MLPLKTILYLMFFVSCCSTSLIYSPVIGVYGYIASYNINPLSQWWGYYLPFWAERYSFILAASVAIGAVLHFNKLKFQKLIDRQEMLLILFWIVVLLSSVFGQGQSEIMDYTLLKVSKFTLIILISSHIITRLNHYEGYLWVLIISGFFLSSELFFGGGTFIGARFQGGVGGSDFGEGNFLAAHFGMLIPIIGIQILKGNWKIKLICCIGAAFILNSIIMVRSRGILLGLLMGGVFSFFYLLKLKSYRKQFLILLIIAAIGAVSLTNEQFWVRMGTINVEQNTERDTSAENRLLAWQGALQMVIDYPLGVGAGNFFQHIGSYFPELAGRDTHNTYLRCLSELGYHGLFVLLLMILNAYWTLSFTHKMAGNFENELKNKVYLHVYAIKTSLIVYLVAAIFISTTYIEEFHWLLMTPVFLKRSVENELTSL